MCSDFPAADAIVKDYFDRGGQPAIAYGIVLTRRDPSLADRVGSIVADE